MAKVTLKIDGKNKQFVKDKLNLGAMKAQAEFEEKLQGGFSFMNEMQYLYRKHRKVLNEQEKLENNKAQRAPPHLRSNSSIRQVLSQ